MGARVSKQDSSSSNQKKSSSTRFLSVLLSRKLSKKDLAQSDWDEETQFLYPSSLDDSVDEEILKLWRRFLRGETKKWKEINEGQKKDHPSNEYHYERITSPGVYWSDCFKNNMVENLSATYPCVALSLAERPLKKSAQVLCSIMQICLQSVISDNSNEESSLEDHSSFTVHQSQVNTVKEVIGDERLLKIIHQHIRWQVPDASYITVENAMIEAMRACLGAEMTPEFEVRLRYKYAMVKKTIQLEQEKFEKQNPMEANALYQEGIARKEEMQKKLTQQEEKGPEEVDEEQDEQDGEEKTLPKTAKQSLEAGTKSTLIRKEEPPPRVVNIVTYSMQDLPDEFNPTRETTPTLNKIQEES